MNKKEISSNILSSNAAEYSSFLAKRSEEFEKIADSGYGLYWFPQCFYLYWQGSIKIDGFELWGNMGPHYTSLIVHQFSEVTRDLSDDEKCDYKSDIFIMTLLGSERRIRNELSGIKNQIYEKRVVLPFKIFLIRFDRLVEKERDTISVDPDSVFKDLEWTPSFRANMSTRSRLVSIGVLEGDSQSCMDKLVD